MYITLQEVREQAGFQFKERSESLGTGDGTTVIFYTDHKPLVDRNYSGTPVGTPDVTVYQNNVEVAVSAVNSDLGKVTLATPIVSGTPVTGDYDWTSVEDKVVENYLAEAHSLIDAKLGEKYSLPLSETPNLIKLIEKKLAAGLLLDKEYSVGGDETEDTRGKRWIKWAEQRLEDIVSGSLELRDSSGNVLSQKAEEGLDGWPDGTTKDADKDDAGGKIQFRVKDEF